MGTFKNKLFLNADDAENVLQHATLPLCIQSDSHDSHAVIQSYSHTVRQSDSHTVIQSYSHTVIQSYSHTVIQSYSHTVIQSYSHTVIQSPATRYDNCSEGIKFCSTSNFSLVSLLGNLLVKTKVFCLQYQQYVTVRGPVNVIPRNFHRSEPSIAGPAI